MRLAMTAVMVLLVAGCAGTDVKSISKQWSVDPDYGVYKSGQDKVKGKSGAVLAKLKEGALGAYTSLSEDGTYVVDLSGNALEADGTKITSDLVSLAGEIGKMFPAGQIAEVAGLIDSGAPPEDVASKLQEMLDSL